MVSWGNFSNNLLTSCSLYCFLLFEILNSNVSWVIEPLPGTNIL